MHKIKDTMICLFDEMLEQVPNFKRKTYNDIFLQAFEKYRYLVHDISDLLENADKSEREDIMNELSMVLPDHARAKMSESSKKAEILHMDYNMNMVIYVIPILTYSHDAFCENLARKMVNTWNNEKITSLTLSLSSYESIANGFKKKLCYITTAVCEHNNKPDDCYELTALRNYRDNYLMKTDNGKALVEEYYEIAPGIVTIINMQQNADEIYRQINKDYLTPCIHHIEAGENDKCCDLYMQMVRDLQKRYLYS